MDARAQELIARLRQNPDDQHAFQALRAHYQRTGDSASLANLLEGYAARQGDARLAAQAYFEAGDLVWRFLGDETRAAALLDRALDREPSHADAQALMISIVEASGDHRRLLDLLKKQSTALARAGDARGRAEIELRMGQIYEHQIGRPDQAIAHYRKAFEADPTMVPAIYAAREIYRNAGNLKAAASLYELEVKAESSPERRVALLRELAHLRLQDLRDVHGAIDALTRAKDENPNDLAVLHELATALLQRADQRGEGAAANEERRRAAEYLVELAQRTPADHALAYCEAALDADPGFEPAMDLLERLAPEQGRPDLLPVRWVGFLHAAPSAARSDERRQRLGFAYLDAGQRSDALKCLEPLLEQGDPVVAESLVELYREQGRDEDASRAIEIAVAGLPPERRVPHLRQMVSELRERGDTAEAVRRARELLELQPGDLEALAVVEEDLRARSDHRGLRDLLIEASRIAGVSSEERKAKLAEAARLSESELDDVDSAIGTWQAVVSLDPTDQSAADDLRRLLEQEGRWDALVSQLEREVLAATDPEAKADRLWSLAEVHRDHRQDPVAAVQAFESLRQIRYDDPEVRNALADVLLLTDAYAQALPLLEERIETASGSERIRLLTLLADTLEHRVGDDERAFAVSTHILDTDAENLDALDRMERIDGRTGNLPRLVDTLAYRCEVVPTEERPLIFARMGHIADAQLRDLGRAAEYYQKALELDAGNVEILDALCSVYDRAERYKDLVVLLRERANIEDDPHARSELYRRIARTLAERVQNHEAAAEAWLRVLENREDEEALRALREHHHGRAEHEDLVDVLARLAELVEDEERRELHLERVDLLADLDRAEEAAALIRSAVLPLAPDHLGAMQRLARLCERLQDDRGLAEALEHQLALIEDPGLCQPIAERLADLYEGPLAQPDKAIDALYAWIDADPIDLEPRVRAIPLLEVAERWAEVVEAHDGIAGLEGDPVEVGVHMRRAAEVAAYSLGDVDGAWSRIAPRISDDAESDALLRRIAADFDRKAQLAELFMQLATHSPDLDEQRRRWIDASKVLEGADDVRALEAMLRAYAIDLADEHMLDEVDRLAVVAEAWTRLAQVYEKLLRAVSTAKAKRKLLMRHAKLLDTRANQQSEALDRVLRACSLVPDDDDVLAIAEELAPRAGRAEELLHVYDVRKSKAGEDARRVDAILRAARLCDVGLQDRERAFQYVAQAIALTIRSPELIETVEQAVVRMDEERPELGTDDAKRTLVGVYSTIADDSEDNPVAGAELLLRAARLWLDPLGDEDRAFRALLTASTYAALPHVLDVLEELALRLDRHDLYDRHLAKLVEDALDQRTAADLLVRRGRLLEETLQRFDEAADVFRRLLLLRKGDRDAADRLLACLRKGERHQDLLVVLDQEIARAKDDDERCLRLLRESAEVWEMKLGNRWEAQDMWKKVLDIDADDEQAREALDRLGAPGYEPPVKQTVLAGVDEPATTEQTLDDEADDDEEDEEDELVTQEAALEDLQSHDSLLDDLEQGTKEIDVMADDDIVLPPEQPAREPSEEDPFAYEDHTVAETAASLDDQFGELEKDDLPAPVGLEFEDTQLAGADAVPDDVDAVPVRDDQETPFQPLPVEEPQQAFSPDEFIPLQDAGTNELSSSEMELLDESGAYEMIDDEAVELFEDFDDGDSSVELEVEDLEMEEIEDPPSTSLPPPPPPEATSRKDD